MTQYMQEFINNFKYLRENKSINKIAKETGITQQTLNRYANGQTEPKVTDIRILSNYLNCTPNDLLGTDEACKSTKSNTQKTINCNIFM